MPLLSDIRKASALVRRAVAARTADREVRATIAARPPHEPHRYRVAVYFADGAVNAYQMRQWYRPLRELAQSWPVVILSRVATGARLLLAESELPVAYVPLIKNLESFIADQDIRIVLYVNQNTRNFQMFRYGRRFHVFINHGESDKNYMISNQFKAYDYAFIAGDAARARLTKGIWDYDVEARTLEIGRPQADHFTGVTPYPPDDRTVVFYAPTWEGDRPSMHYGSVISHGEALVGALLATGRHRVVYRPHPRSGIANPAYGEANARIIAAIEAANAADASAHHVYDTSGEIGWQMSAPDVAIVDISAMIYDRLATGRPLLVTRPLDAQAVIDDVGYLAACEWLPASAAGGIATEVERVLSDPETTDRLGHWVGHYFGDTTPGVATRRFEEAVGTLMRRWDALHDAASAAGEPDDEEDFGQDDEQLDVGIGS